MTTRVGPSWGENLNKLGRGSLAAAIQSNLSYPNVAYPKLLGYSNKMDSPDFFPYYLLQ